MGRDEETKAWEGTPNATAEDGKAQEPVIEMRDIVKRFGDFVANDHVQLKLHKGEVLAILGENGAGKSTLMNILYGMLRPSSGEILVRGQKVEMDSPEKAISLGIGMVHQHFMLIPPFTVAENIILGAEPMQGLTVDLNGAKKRIRELSEQYHLMVDVDAKIGQDAYLEPGVIVHGATVIGDEAYVGAHSVLDNVEVPDGAVVAPLSLLDA